MEDFSGNIVQQLDGEPHDQDSTAKQKWKTLKTCVTFAAV